MQMDFHKAKIYFILLSFYCLPAVAQAQKVFTVNGITYRYKTDERIAQATITDLKSNVIMMSDELGSFNIQTSVGDTLLFNRVDYSQQKLVVKGPGDMIVYLQPIIHLAEVAIKGQSKQQEINDVVNVYRSKGLYFDGKPPALLFNPFGGSPVTGFYELFSKDARDERHFIAFSKDETEAAQVDKRYTKALVKQVTALPDTDVVKFMQQYRPSFEDLKEWNDYELISHIKRYLEYYKGHKNGVPIEKLY
jgi:hypothetical protein